MNSLAAVDETYFANPSIQTSSKRRDLDSEEPETESTTLVTEEEPAEETEGGTVTSRRDREEDREERLANLTEEERIEKEKNKGNR